MATLNDIIRNTEIENEAERHRPDFRATVPCVCQPLHNGCDPTMCDKVLYRCQESEWAESGGPMETLSFTCTLEDVAVGAVNDCKICKAIFQVIAVKVLSLESVSVLRYPGKCTVSKASSWDPVDGENIYRDADDVTLQGCQAFPAALFPDSPATDSKAAFQFLKMCISRCLTKHEECIPQQLYRYPLPRHLVSITKKSGEDKNAMFETQLVEFPIRKECEYLTLSHCWGQQQITMTTKMNLHSRLQGIPWLELSQTFQNAIYITYELDYRYIWIDSLCIVQDDQFDWETESNNMASIYQNSSLTIAASHAKDGIGGCFTPTPELPGRRVLISPLSRDYKSFPNAKTIDKSLQKERSDSTMVPSGASIRRAISHWSTVNLPRLYSSRNIFTKSQHWSLSTRSWTLQEELLATRIVYYGPEELVWQCSTRCDCQCGTVNYKGLSRQEFVDKAVFASTINKKQHATATVAQHQNALNLRWYEIVMEYASRSLTKETDRFPALSGLAKQIQSAGLAPLVAGVPATNVLPWLLWMPRKRLATDAICFSRHPTYIGPSWSWASCPSDRNIMFASMYFDNIADGDDGINTEGLAKVLNISAETSGLDSTGALKSARLVLYAYVSTIRMTGEFYFKPRPGLDRGCDYAEFFDYSEEHITVRGGEDMADQALFLLVSRSTDSWKKCDTIYGLILRLVVSSRKPQYQRIGVFEVEVEPKVLLPWQGFILREVTII